MINSLPFQVASISFLALNAVESGDTSLELFVRLLENKRQARIRITFKKCVAAKLDSVGGEAQGMPGSLGEITDSGWLAEINARQARNNPRSKDNFKLIRHFYFRGEHSIAEICAESFAWAEIISAQAAQPGVQADVHEKP